MTKTELQIKLDFHRKALDALRSAYIALIEGGVQAYSIGSRTLTKIDIFKIMDEIKYHEKQIDALNAIAKGGNRRKAVGIIPRDI